MRYFATIALLGLLFTGCSEAGGQLDPPTPPVIEPEEGYRVGGSVQKGPFITGTSVTIRPLDAKLKPTGESYETQTTDDLGSFEFPAEIAAPYAELVAQGFYYNEMRSELSNAQITLRSLVRLSDEGSNINLLTTLEAGRLRYLVENGGKSFDEARQTARREALAAFGITLSDTTASDRMDISRGGEANAALLAVSCILQGITSNAGVVSELTAKVANDIRDNGSITKSDLQQAIRTNRRDVYAENVSKSLRNRYATLGVTDIQVPDIYGYLDSDGDGVLNGAKPYLLVPDLQKYHRITYERDTLYVDVHSNVKWTAEIPDETREWLAVDSRTTNDRLVLVALPNDGTLRTAQLTLRSEDGTLSDALNIQQFGSRLQLNLTLKVAGAAGGGGTKAMDATLQREVKNLVLIGFGSGDRMLFKRTIADLTADTVNISFATPDDAWSDFGNSGCRIYAIANDFDTYSRFSGDLRAFQEIRTHRDVNDPALPLPRTCIKDMALDYNQVNEAEVLLVHRAARVACTVELAAQDFTPAAEVVEFTTLGIHSQSGIFFLPGETDTDPAYENDYTVTAGADGRYIFHIYGYTSLKKLKVTVRDNGATKIYEADCKNSGLELWPGKIHKFTLNITQNATSVSKSYIEDNL